MARARFGSEAGAMSMARVGVMGSSVGHTVQGRVWAVVLDLVHGTGSKAESILVQEVVLGGVEVTLVMGFDGDVGDDPFFQGVLAG